jgi:hypothetical protein
LTTPVTFSPQNRSSTTKYYCLNVTNARKWAMFARGVACLPTACPEWVRRAHLPALKTLTSNSRVSITSKLIQTKRLQLHYFGHLRKTGGRGSYWFAMSGSEEPARRSFSEGGLSPLFPLHTEFPFVTPFFPLLTQKQGDIPPENVGAPTFLFFPHIFRTFWQATRQPAAASAKAGHFRLCWLKAFG